MGVGHFLVASAMHLAVQDPASAEPVAEQWISDWGEGICKLIRVRGEQREPYFMLQIIPGSGNFELWLVNSDLELNAGQTTRGTSIRLLPGGDAEEISLRRYRFRGDTYDVASGVPADLEALGSAQAIRIERNGRILLDLPLPDLDRAVPVTRECVRDQLQLWGIAPEGFADYQRRARSIGSLASWVRDSDYPEAALRANRSGRSTARVRIGVDGRAYDCVTIVSSGNRFLDRRTCEISGRGRFQPALDASGQPAEDMIIYSVHWML